MLPAVEGTVMKLSLLDVKGIAVGGPLATSALLDSFPKRNSRFLFPN